MSSLKDTGLPGSVPVYLCRDTRTVSHATLLVIDSIVVGEGGSVNIDTELGNIECFDRISYWPLERVVQSYRRVCAL